MYLLATMFLNFEKDSPIIFTYSHEYSGTCEGILHWGLYHPLYLDVCIYMLMCDVILHWGLYNSEMTDSVGKLT